jgi:hypothetical protein
MLGGFYGLALWIRDPRLGKLSVAASRVLGMSVAFEQEVTAPSAADLAVVLQCPTGHTDTSRPPPLPGRLRSNPAPSPPSWKPDWTMTFDWEFRQGRAA